MKVLRYVYRTFDQINQNTSITSGTSNTRTYTESYFKSTNWKNAATTAGKASKIFEHRMNSIKMKINSVEMITAFLDERITSSRIYFFYLTCHSIGSPLCKSSVYNGYGKVDLCPGARTHTIFNLFPPRNCNWFLRLKFNFLSFIPASTDHWAISWMDYSERIE